MSAREEAINQLKGTSAGNEALAYCTRFLDGIEAADRVAVDAMDLCIRRDISDAAAGALLDALKTYRRELDRMRQWAANLMDSIAEGLGVEHPEKRTDPISGRLEADAA